MPSDMVTLAVSTGVGVSVIAGIVSGICYIFAYGLKSDRNRKPSSPWRCAVCGCSFRSIEGVLESGRVVTCSRCGKRVCKVRCSRKEIAAAVWICQTCQRPDSWFRGILRTLGSENRRGFHVKTTMSRPRIDEMDDDLEEIRRKEKEQVRDFIEKVVSAMLEDDVDNASVGKLYRDKSYLPVTGSSPCSAHSSLKHLIQRIVREAIDLPRLNSPQEDYQLQHPAVPEAEDSSRTYEDLLATAILNKVIQNYQDDLPGSARNSISSQRSRSSSRTRARIPRDKEYFFGEETLDSKYKRNCNKYSVDLDTTSISSLESSANSSSNKYGDPLLHQQLSLTIKQRIEEVSPVDDDEDDDDADGMGGGDDENDRKYANSKNDPNWQENWFLQRRKFAGTSSPVPVPMLVPNPTTEAKVLIGEREAEDTTDLSDAASTASDGDYGETASGIKAILIDSRTVIGGKNLLDSSDISGDFNAANDDEKDSGGSTAAAAVVEEEPPKPEIAPKKTEVHVEEDASSPLSLDSNTEQDTEYTEKYASLPRTILKTPVPSPRTEIAKQQPQQNGFSKKVSDERPNNASNENGDDESENEDALLDVFKGAYSTREKEKWKHAVELENNPYSKESLEKRIKDRKSTGSSTLFGRDYYVKASAKPTGARKRVEDQENGEGVFRAQLFWPPGDFDDGAGNEEAIIITDEKKTPLAERGLPEFSSDSDLSIERVYNLQSGMIVEKKGGRSREIPGEGGGGVESAQGLRYQQKKPEELDENHNDLAVQVKKRLFLRSLTDSGDGVAGEDIQATDILTADGRKTGPNVNRDDGDELQRHSLNSSGFSEGDGDDGDDNADDRKMVLQKYIDIVSYTEEKRRYAEDNGDLLNSGEFSLDYSPSSSTSPSSRDSRSPSSMDTGTDSEIVDLKDKHLVKSILGKFSTSYPNLTKSAGGRNGGGNNDDKSLHNGSNKHFGDEHAAISQNLNAEGGGDGEERNKGEELSSPVPSVQVLKLKFEKSQNDANWEKNEEKQIYSLTARSIPKQIRQELKKGNEDGGKEEQFTANHQPETATIADEKPSPFPKAKSRIAYFENLKT